MNLYPELQGKYVPATGNANQPRIMFLGEAPWIDEVREGRPFVGASGKELDRLCADAGINRNDCWISNVCKYPVPPPPKGKKIPFKTRAEATGVNLQQQLEELQTEINFIKPNIICGLGGTALWALKGTTKITMWRGSLFHARGRKCITTFHPAHLLHQATGGEFKGYWNRAVMVLDLKRALDESFTPELKLPSRLLQICTSSNQLRDYIRRYETYTRPAVDIEARGACIPNCVGIAFTPHEGISIPLWHTGEIEQIAQIPKFEIINMWLMLAEFLARHDIVGHNFKYDKDKLRRLGFIVKRIISDTMMKAFVTNPELPKSLAFNTSVFTREPYYKDEGMYEGPLRDLMIGNARDACVTKEVDLALDRDIYGLEQKDFYENFVMHLPDLYLDIENEGFYVNNQVREKLLRKYTAWSEALQHELFTLTDSHCNVASWQQVGVLLFEVLNLPRRAGTGEEELTALLNNDPKGASGVRDEGKRRVIEIILEKRRVDKTIGNYLMALPDFDGKMKTTYYLCLETGRTGTGLLDEPIRPQIEYRDELNKKKKKAIGTAFQTMTKHGDIGQDVRSMYEPEKGYILAQADKAQAEARVVFRLANDEEALYDIDHRDYHALTASWFFGGTEETHSKKILGYESPIRFAGKTLRHAGHLGAGKRRAAISVNTDARKFKIPIRISEPEAERALKIFHAKQPKIQQVFQNGIVECLNKDGRYLTSSVPYGVDSRIGGKRQFFERWGEELFRQAFSYIPQRSITDSTKADALRIRKIIQNIRIIMESHDALLFMLPDNDRILQEQCAIIKYEMERPIRFDTCSLPRPDLIVPCEIEVGYNYQEFKNFKFSVPIEQKLIEAPKEIEVVTPQLSITEQFRVSPRQYGS